MNYTQLSRYSASGNAWTNLAAPPGVPQAGCSLEAAPAAGRLFAFQGGSTTVFWSYSISGNTWTARRAPPGPVGSGGRLVCPGNGDALYAFQGGGSTAFWRYSIGADVWTPQVPAPGPVGAGSALVYPGAGDFLYALRGGGGHELWRYSISGDAWSVLREAPVGFVAASGLVHPGSGVHLFALRGTYVQPSFFRYQFADFTAPAFLAQNRNGSGSAVPVGGWISDTRIDLRAVFSDPDPGDTFKLQFEVRPVGQPFTSPANPAIDNTAFFETGISASNTQTELAKTVTGLTNGSAYHWQVRGVDSSGSASAWVPFGFNGEADADFRVDTSGPRVQNVAALVSDGRYGLGASIPVTVRFSEPVTVTGTPALTLETGASDGVASFESGSGSDTLTFRYVAAAGQNSGDLEYAGTGALALNGGTIASVSSGRAAVLTLPPPGSPQSLGGPRSIVIDTVVPSVSVVDATTPDGTYGVDDVIRLTVAFSEPVTVTGTPTMTLETGAADAVVNYSGGSGTAALAFVYTVAAGQISSDLDGVSAAALALNGGSIRDTAGNAANLTLPAPGAAGSLGANRNLVVVPTRIPYARDLAVTTGRDRPVAIALSGTDPDGGPLSYAVLSQPSRGKLSGTPPSVTYAPDAGFLGTDSFTYRVSDGTASSAPATVRIDVVDRLTVTGCSPAPGGSGGAPSAVTATFSRNVEDRKSVV